MAIKIDNPERQPELVFDYVFMRNLTITQQLSDNSAQPVYNLTIEIQKYAVDDKGVRHFLPKVHVLSIEDYLKLAIAKAKQGDMDLLTAMKSIEVALASILEDQGFTTSTTIV